MARLIHAVVIALAFTACSKTSVTGTGAGGSGTGSAPPVASTTNADGWWEIPDIEGADDIRGGAMKLAATELVALTKGGERAFVRTCTTTVEGATVAITGCGPVLTGTLEGERLVFPRFTATRASRARAVELDKLAAAKRPPADICERALRCLHAFDDKADAKEEAFQLGGSPPDPTACEGYLKGMGMFEAEGKLEKPLPPECK